MWYYLENSELCTYSPEPVEESLGTYSSATPPLSLLRLIPTVSQPCSRDNETDASHPSPSGTTSNHLMESPGREAWISSVADSLVKISLLRERELGLLVKDPVYGKKWQELSVRYCLNTHSWKTANIFYDEEVPPSSVTLPKWGMMQHGVLSALWTQEPCTGEKGSGFWPTPVKMDATIKTLGRKCTNDRGLHGLNLSHCATRGFGPRGEPMECFPTPTVHGNYNRKGCSATSGDGLATAVYKKYPTSTKSMATQSDMDQAYYSSKDRPDYHRGSGTLNPDWVESLMGWCRGWTSLDPLDKEKFKEWLERDHRKSWSASWEDGIPRVAVDVRSVTKRLEAIGNGQVPQCVVKAWDLLSSLIV
jgi:hypothetical protein